MLDRRIVGVAGLVAIALLITGAYKIDEMPLVRSGLDGYRAAFLDAGGLMAGDKVDVAGVTVGRVRSIEIQAARVVVEFDVEDQITLGEDTTISVQVSDLLGTKFLEVEPSDGDALPEGTLFDTDRTAEAYDVVTAFEDLTEHTEALDTDVLAASMDTLAATFENTPDEVRGAMRGIADLSETVSKRDDVIRSLMQHARVTTEVLDERSGDVTHLIRAANQLLAEIERRRDAIHAVLVNTRSLVHEFEGLVRDNQAQMTPALTELREVVRLLEAHQEDLGKTVHSMATYARVFNNTVANGPWFESVLPNVPDTITTSESE